MYSTSRVTSRSSSALLLQLLVPEWCPPSLRADRRAALDSRLQVTVHEVDLLQPAKALADVLRADLAHALDRLELGVAGGEQLVEAAELADDLRDDQLRQPRDAAEDAVAARRDGVVERVQLAVVAEQLGEAAEVEQVLVGEPRRSPRARRRTPRRSRSAM